MRNNNVGECISDQATCQNAYPTRISNFIEILYIQAFWGENSVYSQFVDNNKVTVRKITNFHIVKNIKKNVINKGYEELNNGLG